MKNIQISRYHPKYQGQLQELIISIQRDEFLIPITLKDQPDLFDIERIYQKDNGIFLLALDNEKVVGTSALIDLGNQNGALRKFLAPPDYRGKNSTIASSLLQALVEWRKEKFFHHFYLGTTAKLLAAHRFYKKKSLSRDFYKGTSKRISYYDCGCQILLPYFFTCLKNPPQKLRFFFGSDFLTKKVPGKGTLISPILLRISFLGLSFPKRLSTNSPVFSLSLVIKKIV